MSDQDLFKSENKNNEETPRQPSSDDLFATKLQEIKNESGEAKYKDVATALDALKNSQSFIEQLKRENRELAEKHSQTQSELEKMGTIDDYVKRLQNPLHANPEQPKETPKGESGLSEDRIAELLEERLTARERQAEQLANLARVQKEIIETHGDNAAEFLRQKAKELDTSVDNLKQIAMSNPSMVLALLQSGGQKKVITPTQSSVIPPRKTTEDNPMPTFERSTVHGGLTNKQVNERWQQAKQFTYKRLKVEE